MLEELILIPIAIMTNNLGPLCSDNSSLYSFLRMEIMTLYYSFVLYLLGFAEKDPCWGFSFQYIRNNVQYVTLTCH